MRALLPLLLLPLSACNLGLSFLLPQEPKEHHVDLEVHDAAGTKLTEVHLSERTAFFADGTGYQLMSWPSFDEFGTATDLVWFNFAPNFQGRQTLANGEIRTAQWGGALAGVEVDIDVNWTGDRSFPFQSEGTFVEDPDAPVQISGDFSLSGPNCMNSIGSFADIDTCGYEFTDPDGPYDVTWAPNPSFQFCPQGVVDAAIGTDFTGSISNNQVRLGDVKLECAKYNYNVRHMCGQDPFTVEVDGCEWEIVTRGAPSGDAAPAVGAVLIVSATTQCETAPLPLCDSWFVGTFIE
jgi:hypothetical protein